MKLFSLLLSLLFLTSDAQVRRIEQSGTLYLDPVVKAKYPGASIVDLNLIELGDVSISSLADGDLLCYDQTDNAWENGMCGVADADHTHTNITTTFQALTDTPGTIEADKWLKANTAGNALIWTDAPSGGSGGSTQIGPSQTAVFQIPATAQQTLTNAAANTPVLYNIPSLTGTGPDWHIDAECGKRGGPRDGRSCWVCESVLGGRNNA